MKTGLTLHTALERHFGFRAFLDGQERVIQAVLSGDDTLAVMPTGGGKSLCYQLPALLLDGVTLVVSPLIALMKDQVDALTAKNIPAAFINSSLSDGELNDRIGRLRAGAYRLVYIAPERFKSARFVEALASLTVARFAIDEAHCISQWGHDFRPDYLRLKHALQAVGRPPVIALTATATPEVRADIVAQLGLDRTGRRPTQTFVTGFARHNLAFAVHRVQNKREKLERARALIRDGKTGIVYCATRKNVERWAKDLRAGGFRCVAYHGGLSDDERARAQERFMSGAVPVAVATNAFGMGIDRADLRFILHADIPGSVEAYYQEAGRAGRDGEPARCELLFNYADVRTQEFFIEGANPTRALIAATRAALVRLCAKGPITMSIAAIAEALGDTPNDMAVASALHLLERAGFMRRDYAPGERTYTTELIEPVKTLDALAIDYERLDAKRERDEQKLRRMIAYADCPECRHYYVLHYFGDTDAETHRRCGRCDRCRAQAGAGGGARLPTAEETTIVQKALCCVGRLQGRFGRGRITQTLVGSRAREVLDAGLDRLPTYGLLADEGSDFVWALLDALIAAGCIAVSGEQYPTAALTPLGYAVAKGQQSVPLVVPPRRPGASATTGRARAMLAPEAASGAEPAAQRTRKAGKSAQTPVAFPTTGPAAAIWEQLKTWRREKADALGVPAFMVYPDSTLVQLALRQPRTSDDLLATPGIGPAKLRVFGKETLAIIRAASEGDPKKSGV